MSRKLDALVAERVMNTRPHLTKNDGWYEYSPTVTRLLRYSKDIPAAWKIVEKMDTQIDLVILGGGESECTIWEGAIRHRVHQSSVGVQITSAPLAICLAVLKSVGVPQELIDEALKED